MVRGIHGRMKNANDSNGIVKDFVICHVTMAASTAFHYQITQSRELIWNPSQFRVLSKLIHFGKQKITILIGVLYIIPFGVMYPDLGKVHCGLIGKFKFHARCVCIH